MEAISLMYSLKQAALLKEDIMQNLSQIIDDGQFIQGPEVARLEKIMQQYTGSKFAIGCANGTDALTVALMALDVKPGDVVFTPSFTYVATAEAIALLNAQPYFVDIDPISYNICLHSLEESIKDAVQQKLPIAAIISVDLFGNPAPYSELKALAQKYNLKLISDAAQAFGASYKNQKIGSLADIATTSFFPTKPLGCYGDGGMVFTNDEELSSKIKSICFHGKGEDKYHHVRIGMNSRLDTVQAAVLIEKMKIFSDEIKARNTLAAKYNSALKNIIITPIIDLFKESAWAVYTLRHKNRDEIISKLAEHKIPSNVYYKTPLHLQPAYLNAYKSRDLLHSQQAAKEVFCLPMHAYINDEQSDYIIEKLTKILKKHEIL